MTSLSVVVPVFNERFSIHPLLTQLQTVLERLVNMQQLSNYEILIISDGSTDLDTAFCKQEIKTFPSLKFVILQKRFGKAIALQTGFDMAQTDLVVTLDGDLQDDPTEIPRFLQKIKEGFDVVCGWKKERLDPWEKRIPSKVFNFVTTRSFGLRLHDLNCGFKMYRKEVVKGLNLTGGLYRYIPVIVTKQGYHVTEIAVKHHPRSFGKSKYGFLRYLHGLRDFLLVFYVFNIKKNFVTGRISLTKTASTKASYIREIISL